MSEITTIQSGMTGSQFISALNNNAKTGDVGFSVGSVDYNSKTYDYMCDGTADEVQINLAITAANALTNGGAVYLSPGIFNLSSAIKIKSNVALILTPRTTIYLSDGANDSMIENDDLTNGNSFFFIHGGIWNGNRDNQTEAYTSTPDESFWGFGFLLRNATNFDIQDIHGINSGSWFIAHFNCSDFVIRNIKLNQKASGNADGISGSGCQNAIIENIHGYTGDDMIAVGALDTFSGSISGNKIEWASRDCINVKIRNIQFEDDPDLEGDKTYAGIGIYAGEGMSCKDILIDGVYGRVDALAFVHVVNYWPTEDGKGYIRDITVRNMNVESSGGSNGFVGFSDYDIMEVENFVAENLNMINTGSSYANLIHISDSVKHTSIKNISAKNIGDNITPNFILKCDQTGQDMTVSISGVDLTGDIGQIYIGSASTGLRIHAPDCSATFISRITAPEDGDMIREENTGHPLVYDTDGWYDLLTGLSI